MSIVKDLCLNIILASIALYFCFKYFSLYKNFITERNYFIKTLSHDIRVTVLAQLRGLNLLKNTPDKNSSKFLLEDINNSAEYALEMINTLINTYKFENGDNILNSETFNFSQDIFSICTSLAEIASEKNILINKNFANCSLYGDRAVLNKAIKILLSTAIQQAYQNSKITCSLNNNNGKIIFIINYLGKPLTHEEQQRIFSKHSRFSTVGQGIKIHFCKKIIDFHSGKIQITNKKDKNSFIIILPNKKPVKQSKTTIAVFSNA